jgi:hypothetical protein
MDFECDMLPSMVTRSGAHTTRVALVKADRRLSTDPVTITLPSEQTPLPVAIASAMRTENSQSLAGSVRALVHTPHKCNSPEVCTICRHDFLIATTASLSH